jgi:hypothetical protein
MSDKSVADVTIGKADVAEARLGGREQALDKLSEDVAKGLMEAQKALEQELHRLGSLEKRGEVVSHLTKMFQAEGKPSKRQIGKAFDRILQATPSYADLVTAVGRVVDAFQANSHAETIIRNFLYTQTLRANIQGRALRAVLDKRLGAPITDDELKAATEKILADDEERARSLRKEEQDESFEGAVKQAQLDQAARESDTEPSADPQAAATE